MRTLAGSVCSLSLFLLSSGCGTLWNGGSQNVEIASPTPGATAVVTKRTGGEAYRGPLPVTLDLSTKDDYRVVVSAPGRSDGGAEVKQAFNFASLANVFWVVPVFVGAGIGVDAFSGGLWKLSPSSLNVSTLPAVEEKECPSGLSCELP